MNKNTIIKAAIAVFLLLLATPASNSYKYEKHEITQKIEQIYINAEIEQIKIFEVGENKKAKTEAYTDFNGKKLIGYGFATRYFWPNDTITQLQADSLLRALFLRLYGHVSAKYPAMNPEQKAKAAHILFWVGPKNGYKIIGPDGVDKKAISIKYKKYKKRSLYFL